VFEKKVTLIGAGRLGSFTTLLMAKMASAVGWAITVRDFDDVEAHNVLDQLYRKRDVGPNENRRKKTEALRTIVRNLTDVNIATSTERADSTSELHGIVVVLVDTMKARKEIFDASFEYDIPYYIEARAGRGQATVYAFDPRNPDTRKKYRKTLYADDEPGVQRAPCANSETVPILWMVAATVAQLLVRHANTRLTAGELLEVAVDMNGLPHLSGEVY